MTEMAWKFIGLSDKSFQPPATLANSLIPKLDYFNNLKFRVNFMEVAEELTGYLFPLLIK